MNSLRSEMFSMLAVACGVLSVSAAMLAAPAQAAELGSADVYSVFQIEFTGTSQTPSDKPSINVDFDVLLRHESGAPQYRILGFWDGDGAGGTTGGAYKVRFTPTAPGRWDLVEVNSSDVQLQGQKQGDHVSAIASGLHGFWQANPAQAGGRWFQRSDGTYQYIIGNTHYDFLSQPNGVEATAASIAEDVEQTALRFNKLRFVLRMFRTENRSSVLRPFMSGNNQSDSESDQPNPQFYSERVDVAVERCQALDIICDLVMGGTTGDQVVDKEGYYRYIAARYGSYPNVWITLSQEWDEQVDAAHEFDIGTAIRALLPYPTPVSTHALDSVWDSGLNGPWHTHGIVQNLAGDLSEAADRIGVEYQAVGTGKPIVNEEVGYDPGAQSENEVIETTLGVFAGGGYATTGNKIASKQGAYFWGHTSLGDTIVEHPSADNLQWLRERIDADISFWEMAPPAGASIFSTSDADARVLEWPQEQYLLFTDTRSSVTVALPTGQWDVISYDVIAMTSTQLGLGLSGSIGIDTPDSVAAMVLVRRADDGPVDTDNDGVIDTQDNCTNEINPAQIDADSDGFGNVCDPDFNNDGIVDFLDLELLKGLFFGSHPVADMNFDGTVDFLDLAIMKALFFGPPGPSGTI